MKADMSYRGLQLKLKKYFSSIFHEPQYEVDKSVPDLYRTVRVPSLTTQ